MVSVGRVCNLSMLQYIKDFGPVEIDELYKSLEMESQLSLIWRFKTYWMRRA